MGFFSRGNCFECGKKFGIFDNQWNLPGKHPQFGKAFVCDRCESKFRRAKDQEFLDILREATDAIGSGALFNAVKDNN